MAFQLSSIAGRPTGKPLPFEFAVLKDEVVDDNDKVADVSALAPKRFLHVVGLRLVITTSSTAGNRVFEVVVKDADGDVVHSFDVAEGDTTGPDITNKVYELAPHHSSVKTVGSVVQGPLDPGLFVPEGGTVEFNEKGQLSGVDDMLVYARVLVY